MGSEQHRGIWALQRCKKLADISKTQKIKQKWGRRLKRIEMGNEDTS